MWKLSVAAVGLALALWAVRRSRGADAPPSGEIRPDPVDQAIYESFPASDPPSWAGA